MAAEACPRCDTPRVGAFRYCRSCGLDFDDLPLASATAGWSPDDEARDETWSPDGQPAAPSGSADRDADAEGAGDRLWSPTPNRAHTPQPTWTPASADWTWAPRPDPETLRSHDPLAPDIPGWRLGDDVPAGFRRPTPRGRIRLRLEAVLIAAIGIVGVAGGVALLSPPPHAASQSPTPSRTPPITPTPTRQRLDIFSRTGDLIVPRAQHTATLLKDGRVFVAGGFVAGGASTASTEIYDPATAGFTAGPRLLQPRDGHVAVLLADGRVLIGGGWNNGALVVGLEVYDPGTQTIAAAGSLKTGRLAADAVRLSDGRVLFIGGVDAKLVPVGATEVFDPATGSQATGPKPATVRAFGSVTPLPDGRILVAGGGLTFGSSSRWVYALTATASAELYDPATGRFATTGSLKAARAAHAATRLADGRVLVLGGGNPTKAAIPGEVYDPGTGRFLETGGITLARAIPTATTLAGGRVLVAGGLIDGAGKGLQARDTSELFDPASAAFTAGAPLGSAVARHTATLMPDGQVLVIGGFNGLGLVSGAAEFYY